jgi:hypothetical protein
MKMKQKNGSRLRTRYLKKQNINITFRTSNTLGKYLKKAFCKSANSELLDKCGL